MFKVFSASVLLFLLIPVDFSFAQSRDDWASKTYSGYLHQDQKDVHDRQCFIEFKSPVPFTHQLIAQVPEELTYSISFKDSGKISQGNSIKGKGAFEKFVIKIYTNDGQEYSIDPDAEDKQIGTNDEHHIFDSYLVYLILGQDINHLEVVSLSGRGKDKYVLDKLEIRNDD